MSIYSRTALLATVAFNLAACNSAKFTATQSSSASLKTTSVFGSNGDGDASGTITQPSSGNATNGNAASGTGNSSSGSVRQPALPANVDPNLLPAFITGPAPAQMPLTTPDASTGLLPAIQPSLVCGPIHQNDAHNGDGPTLVLSTGGVFAALYKSTFDRAMTAQLVEKLVDPAGTVDLASRIYSRQAFQLRTSAALTEGYYYIVIFPDGQTPPASMGWGDAGNAIGPLQDSAANILDPEAIFSVDANGNIKMGTGTFSVLLDTAMHGNPQQASPTRAICGEERIGNIDPLMIDFSGAGIQLSEQSAGMFFDLVGDGRLEQISWPTNPLNMFLVHGKTNNGQITGDQMFGNYTTGPDNEVASNGFAALQKYDANHDGRINRADAIFSELRLWSDANRNGLVDDGELKTLAEMNVTSIDLHGTPIVESDAHGNQSLLRASVNLRGGQHRVISDIWFKPAY